MVITGHLWFLTLGLISDIEAQEKERRIMLQAFKSFFTEGVNALFAYISLAEDNYKVQLYINELGIIISPQGQTQKEYIG